MTRKARARKAQRAAPSTDHLTVALSSGYTLVVKRPPLNVIRAITTKAEKLYPDPDPPTQTIQTVTGMEYTVAADGDEAYQEKLETARNQRLEYFLEYVFQECLEVQGYETEEARQELIAAYADERDKLLKWGDVPEDMLKLDDWQFTLRMFIVADASDYAALMLSASKAFDINDIGEEDLRQRVNFL